MASVNEFEETLSSITSHSYISLITMIINVTAIIHLYSYFKNENTEVTGYLKLHYLPFTSWTVMSLLFLILNNHAFPRLNDTFSLIDDYCHILSKIGICFGDIVQSSLSIFLLTRLKYIFQSTPYKVKSYEYKIQMVLCIFVSILTTICSSMAFEGTIYIAMDNPNYKLCHLNLQTEMPNFLLLCIAAFANDSYLIYLLFTKFRKYQENTDQLLQDESLNSKVKNLKLGGILLMFSKSIFKPIIIGISMLYGIKYALSLCGIADCIVLLYCVDSKIFANNNGSQIQQQSPEELDRQLQEIMEQFFAPPRLSQGMDNIDDETIPLVQIEGQ